MSITEEFHFDNRGEVVRFPWLRRSFLTIIIVLVAFLAFGVGRLTVGERAGVSINYDPSLLDGSGAPGTAQTASVISAGAAPSAKDSEGQVTASSQGTRYYYSHCKNTISEKNRVVFTSAEVAEKAGYTLAANCKPR